MKKVFLILLLLFVTGCGKTKLECSKSEKNAGYDYHDNYVFYYNEKTDDLDNIVLTIESKFNDLYTEEEINEQYESVIEYCDKFSEESDKAIKCNIKRNGKEIKLEVKINVSSADKDTFENIMYITKEELNNIKTTKKLFENVGYKCK